MKEIGRCKMKPVVMLPEDTITLIVVDENGEETKVLTSTAGKEMELDEAVTFLVEKGDFKGAKGGIGGAFLEME